MFITNYLTSTCNYNYLRNSIHLSMNSSFFPLSFIETTFDCIYLHLLNRCTPKSHRLFGNFQAMIYVVLLFFEFNFEVPKVSV